MAEQRTPLSPTPSSRRSPLAQSFSALRYQVGRRSHSRRQSLDIESSQLNSTVTYFPNPSSFSQSTGPSNTADTSYTAVSPSMPARQPRSVSILTRPSDTYDESRGDQTPTMRVIPLDSAGSSLRTRGNSPVEIGRPSRMTSRTLSNPVTGYKAKHRGLEALGLCSPNLERSTDDALSSPRRITTSRIETVSRSQSPTSSHGAYYSQSPSTITTPRVRPDIRDTFTPSAQFTDFSRLGDSSSAPYAHHRHASVASYRHSPHVDTSPAGTVVRRLRSSLSQVGLHLGGTLEYDGTLRGGPSMRGDAVGEPEVSGNGMRVWYRSFVTIDWLHDAIKESSRVRRLRYDASRSLRGGVANAWDRVQGWLVVTIIGIASAVIAFLIIRVEMALFDLKEGYCSSSWGTAERFCCAPHHRDRPGGIEVACGDWVKWAELLAGEEGSERAWVWGGPEFAAYSLVALLLAISASCLTVYLSSSVHHNTSKDGTLSKPVPYAVDGGGTSNGKDGTERQPLLSKPPLSRKPSGVVVDPRRKVMFYAAGSGIPEIKTILSGFVIHGYLGGWTLFTKSVGLALSVASGLSLGKEGPLVHISCCVGNIVSRLFLKFECNEAKRREILSAACAAGVSVAFGAPIGGVLFSLEEVSYFFPPKVLWRSFWCAAVAAITLKGLNPFGNSSLVMFTVSYTKEYHHWEYAIFILLGVFGGVYGAVFSRLNFLWSKHVRQETWVKRHPIVEVALVTALTTCVSFFNPYCRMGGTELVSSLFAECHPHSSTSLCVSHPREMAQVIMAVGIALLIKGCLTIVTFGIKLPAGIFIPSLVVGACFGRILGLTMEWVEFQYPALSIFDVCRETQCIVPGLYAMIGAAATLAGVTRTTVSLAVIVLELTGTLNYVIPVMLAVLVAKTVADGLERKGIYDLVIDLNELPFLDQKHEYLWGGRRVCEVADRDVPILRADKLNTVRSLMELVLQVMSHGLVDTGFPVLVKETIPEEEGRTPFAMRVVGFLGLHELEHALSELANEPEAVLSLNPEDTSTRSRASHVSIFSFADSYSERRHHPHDISRYIDRAPLTVQSHSPLELVQQLFVKLGAKQLLVTDSRGVFKGMVTKKAWLNFLKELEKENG